MHYLYVTTNDLTGQKYVGQRKCPINKTPESDNYFGSGTRLINVIKKHGKAYFSKEIIKVCETQFEIDVLEIDYIRENKVLENKEKWYNLDAGGQYGRSEEHAKLTSISMKNLYNSEIGRNKVIHSTNKSRIKKGINPLPYKNYKEFLQYKQQIKDENHRQCIISKVKFIKSRYGFRFERMAWNEFKNSEDYDVYKQLRIKNGCTALWSNNKSISKRSISHKNTWDKRKESKDIWTDKNKQSFAIGKLKQCNNLIGLYLIEHGVSLRINGLQKKIKKCLKQYKDIYNMYKQIDNIISTVYNTQQVRIDKEELTCIILKSRSIA
jgi:hypothetical protein